jgi:small subunit ribosomal protein S21
MRQNNFLGNRVFAKDGEPFDKMLRRFKRKVEESNLMDVLRSKEFYEKPTTERKRKAGAAKARWRKKLRDKELPKKLF